MFLIVLLFISTNLFSMNREETQLSISSHNRSPDEDHRSIDSISSDEEENDLCDFAMRKYCDLQNYVKPYLKNMLQDSIEIPHLRQKDSTLNILKKIKSEENNDRSNNDKIIHDIVMKAVHIAFHEKEKELELKEKRIRERYSGKKTAGIAAISGTISTIVTTLCTTMVTLHTSK